MSNKKPILLIVAGANGSGKTTLVNTHKKIMGNLPFVNPDDIAKEIDPNYDGKDGKLIMQASREAIKRQNNMLKNKQSFGLETTFSGNRELKIMQQAKEAGYDVRIAYVGLDNPIKNIKSLKKEHNEKWIYEWMKLRGVNYSQYFNNNSEENYI